MTYLKALRNLNWFLRAFFFMSILSPSGTSYLPFIAAQVYNPEASKKPVQTGQWYFMPFCII